METAFKIICNFSDVWNMIVFDGLGILFRKLELNFIGKEKFDEKFHNLAIFFKLKIVVQEHLNTSTY